MRIERVSTGVQETLSWYLIYRLSFFLCSLSLIKDNCRNMLCTVTSIARFPVYISLCIYRLRCVYSLLYPFLLFLTSFSCSLYYDSCSYFIIRNDLKVCQLIEFICTMVIGIISCQKISWNHTKLTFSISAIDLLLGNWH